METVQPFPRERDHETSTGATGLDELANVARNIGAAGAGGYWLGGNVANPNASIVYLQVFDVPAASVTVGTTVPVYTEAIPASTAYRVGDGYPVRCNGSIGDDTDNPGMSAAITTTRRGSTAAGADCSCAFRRSHVA